MFFDDITYKILIAFFVLVAGFIISRVGERAIIYLWRKKHRVTLERVQVAHVYGLIINVIFIVIALSVLKINITENALLEVYGYFPLLLSAILLAVLIFLGVGLIFFFVDKFLSRSGIRDVVEEYGQEENLDVVLAVIKYVLYFAFALVALNVLGVNISSAVSVFKTVLYPILLLGLLLLFVGLKPLVENLFSGLFLKWMNFLRVGEQVKIERESYTVDKIRNQGVVLRGKDNFSVFVPFKKLYAGEVRYKEIVYDLDVLEKVKSHYVAQHPSYCGPASASMVLGIFGYEVGQKEIGKLANTVVPSQKRLDGRAVLAGTKPKELVGAVEKLTDGKVRGVFISVDEINDLKMELKTWLSNKALIIIDYKKSFLFPEAEKAHYSVCFSIRGDELLILDPSAKSGGVYFADVAKVYRGMNTYSEFIGGKRGYIVLAPKGTTAYHRIEKGLIYSDSSLYKHLNNNLSLELGKLVKSVGRVETIFPKSIQKVIEEYKRKEKVARVWRPGAG